MKKTLIAGLMVAAATVAAQANGHSNWAWTQAPTAFSEPNYHAVTARGALQIVREEVRLAQPQGGIACFRYPQAADCFGGGPGAAAD